MSLDMLVHITHESSLECTAFGLCSAWRFGDVWRFGDSFNLQDKKVWYIYMVTSKSLPRERDKVCEYDLRVRILKHNGLSSGVYTALYQLLYYNENNFHPKAAGIIHKWLCIPYFVKEFKFVLMFMFVE